MAREQDATSAVRPAVRLSDYLERRLTEMCPGQGMSLFRRVWNTLQGTKVSVVVSTVTASLAIMDCLTKESYLDASLGIRITWGVVSCTTAQYLYAWRRAAFGTTLRTMAVVARALEATADAAQTKDLELTARYCNRLQRGWDIYSIGIVFTVLFPTIAFGDLSMPVWPRPEDTPMPSVAFPLALVAQCITGAFCPIALYSLVGWMMVAQASCSALYRCAGVVVERAEGAAQLRWCARVHGLLSDVSYRLDRLTSANMLLLLSGVLVLPIQSTYDALQGRIDAFLLSSFFTILAVFVPLCFGSQGLSDASVEVGRRAYSAEWPAEDPRSRVMRSLIMVRAAKPATITCRGLGVLGLPACESVLKSWFSYMQMVLNTMKKKQ